MIQQISAQIYKINWDDQLKDNSSVNGFFGKSLNIMFYIVSYNCK